MDIVLVKVNSQKKIFQDLSEDFSGIEPPLWMIITAAYLRDQGFDVVVLDAEAENIGIEETIERVLVMNPLCVATVVSGTNPSASTINMTGTSEFLNKFKMQNPDVPLVISGLHPSALPKETLEIEACDFLIEGEGFSAYAALLQALKSGKTSKDIDGIESLWIKNGDKIISNKRAQNVEDVSTLPMPAWDLLPMEKYRAHNWHCFGHIQQRQPYAVIYTSLGCPFNCRFCCINAIFGKPGIRYRSPEKVVEEIDFLVKNYGVKNIKVLDEMFILKWSHVEELCDRIIATGHDLNFWVYGRIDTVKEHMLQKMKQAGMNWIAYGIEAGSKRVRDGVAKGRFDEEKVKEVVKMTHDAGMHIVANFIFGLPDDDQESMQETLKLANELNCAYTNFYCAMAYPGSQLYRDALAADVTLPQTWNGYSQFSMDSLPLPTKHCSSGEVLKFRDEAFDVYHTRKEYFDMIEKCFDHETVEHIKKMCSLKLKRNHYQFDDGKRFVISEDATP